MRNRRVRNRLDLLDLEYSQIGEPTVESEQRIMIGTESLRFGLTDRGATEHSANRNAVDGGALDAEADDATGKYVHDQHDPMAAHQDRFNKKHTNSPPTGSLQALRDVAGDELSDDGDGPAWRGT
jgi:hypothetical protein